MAILLLGGSGQLGCSLHALLKGQSNVVIAPGRDSIDLASASLSSQAILDLLETHKPRCVFNCAAFTDVKGAESDPHGAFIVNAIAPWRIAQACKAFDVHFVHISTDYVFDGSVQRPYGEGEVPRPINAYGNSKLAGEYFVQSTWEKTSIVRTAALYGPTIARGKGYNFVSLMLKLAREGKPIRVVADEITTPTTTIELARHLVAIMHASAYGLFHATNEGECSWYEFAEAIFDEKGLRPELSKASAREFSPDLNRPAYSVLDNAHLRDLGLNRFMLWRDALHEMLEQVSW